MPVPWLRVLNTLVGVADFALTRNLVRQRREGDEEGRLSHRRSAQGLLEMRLAGAAIAALKEVFDRDSRRLEFEREQAEAERRRAERALQLELLRQAGERELARLRLLAGTALVSWLAALVLAVRLADMSAGARVALGAGWAALLGALAVALIGGAAIGKALTHADPGTVRSSEAVAPRAGTTATWLIVAGLALVGLAVLVTR